MCEPTTIVLIASAAVSAGAAIAQGGAQKRQAYAESRMLQTQAAQTRDSGKQQADRIRRRTAMERGAAVGAAAGSGIRVGEGSALEVERYIQLGGEEDAMLTLLNADRASKGLQEQASLRRKAGSNAQLAGYVNGAGSLLSLGSGLTGWGGTGAGMNAYDANGYGMGTNYGQSLPTRGGG